MRLIGLGAKGRLRIRKKLTAWGVAAAVIAGMSVGFIASSAPANASATMTLAQFVAKYNKQYLDMDGLPKPPVTKYQCVDVFMAYDDYVVGSGVVQSTGGNGGADAYWTNSALNNRYTHIAPTQAAHAGDVAVWGGGEDGYGHVAIVLSAAAASPVSSASKLSVLTQNPGPVQEKSYGKVFNVTWSEHGSYHTAAASLLGFLRPKTAATPPVTTPVSSAPGVYHAGKQVSIVSQATTGVSGHSGPTNQNTKVGPNYAKNAPIWIVCYVTGQSIKGPYGTEAIWDLSDNGWYYSDAWVWTGTNGAAVPACSLKTVSTVSQATTGVNGHTGPGNQYPVAPNSNKAKGASFQIACYVDGQSIKGPYGTEAIWDLAVGGWYYSDAWLWTGTNGAAVRHC